MRNNTRRDSRPIYTRQLPGGGFVAIEVTTVRNVFAQRQYHGAVVVERRADRKRREGHDAPVVAEANAATIATVFHELFPIAHSNIAIAAECLARQREELLTR